MLHIEHYSKMYPGGKKAVDDLTLHVGPGEIYGFIGHNGAGKTTTLRAVAGVMDFTEGTITIDGHDIKKAPVQAKRVTAFLPDNPDIYEFMKGIDYLNFIADLYDTPADQRTADIGKYSDAFWTGMPPWKRPREPCRPEPLRGHTALPLQKGASGSSMPGSER